MLPSPRVAILIQRNYWLQTAPGNSSGYRAVREIEEAVAAAGGTPVLVYHGSDPGDDPFDALILPGGGDIHPRHYGQAPDPATAAADPDFDAFQIAWTRRALARGTPMLGICRGMQVMNVAAGGTLVQDLPEHLPEGVLGNPVQRRLPVHGLRVDPASRLGALVGERSEVNSIHHQGLDRVAPAFRVTARALDGVVEAMENPGAPWQNGVQFHPEDLRHSDPRVGGLFADLVRDALQVRRPLTSQA